MPYVLETGRHDFLALQNDINAEYLRYMGLFIRLQDELADPTITSTRVDYLRTVEAGVQVSFKAFEHSNQR